MPAFHTSTPLHNFLLLATSKPQGHTAQERLQYCSTLGEVFLATVAAHPQALALDTPNAQLTYQELHALAALHQRALAEHGIGIGDRVGVQISSGTVQLYVGILGTLLAGAAYVPVDADDTPQRAHTVWREAAVCAVLTDSPPETGTGSLPTLTMSRTVRPLGSPDVVHLGEASDDAWVIFTSGSTGTPKGVAVTHTNAMAFLRAESHLFVQHQPLGPDDRVMAALSCAFDASIEEIWLAWAYGACLVAAPRSLVKDVVDVEAWIHTQRITVISTVPSLASLWHAEMITSVRLLIVGGEACPSSLVDRLATPEREMWNTYGPTETTVVATAAQLRPGMPVMIGHALSGWEIAVVSPAGQPVADGERGELVVSGAGVARYLDPALDAEKFAPLPALGWSRAYRTGDAVRMTEGGVEYLGRLDDQVKIAGRRLELGEIDALLMAQPGVAMAAAAVRRTDAGTSVLVGYVLPEPEAEIDLSALRANLVQGLPPGISLRLTTVTDLPVKISGKVDRNALPWPVESQISRPPSTLATAEEQAVAEVWATVLGVEVGDVGANDDFFAAGGGSLTAAQLVTRLRARYPSLAVADVYASPTIAGLAMRLEEHARDADVAAEARRHAEPTDASPSGGLAGSRLTQIAQVLGYLSMRSALALMVALSIVVIFWLLELEPRQLVAAVVGLALASLTPVRMILAVALIRVIRPSRPFGLHPRGGVVHLRLRAAGSVLSIFGMTAASGTIVNVWLARLLGCRVGSGVFLDVVPPVHGGLDVGDRAVVEHQADVSGVMVTGTEVLIGRVRLGTDAVVSTRAMVLPGVQVGSGAVVAAGVAARHDVPATTAEPASASPQSSETALVPATRSQREGWGPRRRNRWGWEAAYFLGAGVPDLVTVLAMIPLSAAIIWSVLTPDSTTTSQLLAMLTAAAILSIATYAAATIALVRTLNRWVVTGEHPQHSAAGLASWMVLNVTAAARVALFPLYASQASSWWLRMLGARVGKNVEISTVTGLPSLLSMGDGSFLADDVLVAAPVHRPGLVRLGPVRIGHRSFVGNSGIVLPDTEIGDDALIGVLTTAPHSTPSGTSWLGRPAISLPRHVDQVDASLTYQPGAWVRIGRGFFEVLRIVPMLVTLVFFEDIFVTTLNAYERSGWMGAALTALILAWAFTLAAGISAAAAKWILVGRIRTGHHPLWSSFVWRNELADCFLESLAMPWLLAGTHGTPVIVAWLRACGAKIGRHAWCETHWFPEHDIISVGDGVTLNRGVVVQTHLFHDRVMRVEPISIGDGSSLSPHAITLPDTVIGAGTLIGSSSLVMRGEEVPAQTAWVGNPIRMDSYPHA